MDPTINEKKWFENIHSIFSRQDERVLLWGQFVPPLLWLMLFDSIFEHSFAYCNQVSFFSSQFGHILFLLRLQWEIETLEQQLVLSMKKLEVLSFSVTWEEKIRFKTLGMSNIIITDTHVYQSTQMHIDRHCYMSMNIHFSGTTLYLIVNVGCWCGTNCWRVVADI